MKRSESACDKFVGGYNCSQAVLCAFCGKYGIDEKTAFKLAEGFGMGMGGLKDECGALTGMFMTIGLENSDGVLDGSKTKMDTYGKLMEAAKAFEAEIGSIKCGEILKKAKEYKDNASADEVAEAKSKQPICVKCVKTAAEYLENNIVK